MNSAMKPTLKEAVQPLIFGKVGKTRQKAIMTIAKKNNITRNDARFRQAIKIAQKQIRKNG